MNVTPQLRQDTLAAITQDFDTRKSVAKSYSQSRHANFLGINTSVYSRMKNGETDRVLSEGEWVRLAKQLQVQTDDLAWKVAKTPTFRTITGQLSVCMSKAIGGIFCDDSSLGKIGRAHV